MSFFSTVTSGTILIPIDALTCATNAVYVAAPPRKKKRKKKVKKKPVSMYCRVVEP